MGAILDGLDGRVARMTHTQSAFGAEYDSLSDMVSFGVAPALVIYEFALQGLGKLGWIAAYGPTDLVGAGPEAGSRGTGRAGCSRRTRCTGTRPPRAPGG